MFAVIAGIFGLIIGSFLNVVILRRGARPLSGRSSCFSCGATINWYDLVPLFSWVLLRGRCRNCNSPISMQYPLVEAATGVLFGVFTYWATPSLLLGDLHVFIPLMLGFAITAYLVAIATYDLNHTIIPDSWVYIFAILSLLFHLFIESGAHALSGADLVWIVCAGPVTALPLFLLWYISNGRWMGLGDAKLALGMGWLLGIGPGLLSVMYSFILGSFILVPFLLITHIPGLTAGQRGLTMKSEVPFGPFLIASCLIFLFLGLFGIPLPIDL
jgi:leader peptidase (prepilin peptidase) / N-methyltransferase